MGLTGVGNARELGGYPAGDGRVVKHGVFLRTASLAGATDKDKERLKDDYQLSVVIDLRMTREKESAPDPEISGVRNIHLGIIDEVAVAEKQKNLSAEDLEGLDMNNKVDRLILAIKAGIVSDQMYIEWLSSATGKAGYAQMFKEMIDLPEGKALLFHCTQGKDRTGCAAMLILSALGVDEDTILKDYMLTNTYNADLISSERQMLIDQGYEGQELDRYMKAMDEVDIQYMVNALEWMKNNYGAVKGYITKELGLTEAQIEQLQTRYLHNMTAHPAKEATCTEPGNIDYWTCDCGKYFSDVQGENEIGKDDVVIQAKGHTSVKDPAVAPTHTNTGLTEGSHCSVCGAIIKIQEVD